MRIVLCIPGNKFSEKAYLCGMELVCECMKRDIGLVVSNAYNAVVSFARNACLKGDVLRGIGQKPFDGKIKYDYMVWIDSDIIYSVKNVFDLIKKCQQYGGIVSGIYKMQDNKHFAVSKKFDVEYLKKHGRYEFLTADNMPNAPFLADAVGFGFCAVKYGVFENMTYPWFQHEPVVFGNNYDFLSEDFSFCERARFDGHNIFVDPSIRVGHEKTMVL